MSARSAAVARVLVRAYGRDFDTDDIAKRAIRAADRSDNGRRMPRTLTTAEELDALPNGAVVLSDVYIAHHGMAISFQRWEDGMWHRGARSGSTHPDNFLPVTVLHVPGANGE